MGGHVGSPHTIVHVVHSLRTGGLEHGVVNVVNRTSDRFRHVVVCLSESGPAAARLADGVEVFEIAKRDGQDPAALLRLVRVLRRVRPAIVHTRNWGTFDAVLAARVARVPRVIHAEHGRDIADPEGSNRRRNAARRLAAPLIDRFLTVSRDLAGWLEHVVRVPARKIVTIVNGVDTDRFAAVDPGAARLRLGLPADGLVVGTVGRLDPVKDQAGLLRAFARLVPEHPSARLVVAGDGPCRDELERAAAELALGDRVHLLGERRDVPDVLAALDVFVLPSIAEGISNTILEAMATGLPVVATRVGGNPELVEDGVNGRLVPPRDPDALAAALAAYLNDAHLCEVHGKTSRAHAVARFGLRKMTDDYAAVYDAVLGQRA